MNIHLGKLEKEILYKFKDRELLKAALTHRSYAAEHKITRDNQRLEFLGDAVIQIVISEYLYNLYPDEREGVLTTLRSAIVQKETLAEAARVINLGEYIMLGRGEIEAEGQTRDSTLCDAFEALIAAIFLDSDHNIVRELLLNIFKKIFTDPLTLVEELNPKGVLQEYTQKKLTTKPEYKIQKTSGPAHDLIYVVGVYLKGKLVAVGEGGNRKAAEGKAAKEALNILRKRVNGNLDK